MNRNFNPKRKLRTPSPLNGERAGVRGVRTQRHGPAAIVCTNLPAAAEAISAEVMLSAHSLATRAVRFFTPHFAVTPLTLTLSPLRREGT